MSDFQKLYDQKCLEFEQLKEEYEDYKETSKIYEDELESQTKTLEKHLAEAKNKLLTQSQDLTKKQEEAQTKIKQLEKELDTLKSQHKQNQLNSEIKQRLIVDLEIVTEKNNNFMRLVLQLYNEREKDVEIGDLEQKFNDTLEQLAIVQTELENRRNDSQDQIERLKQQLRDNQDELFVTKQKTQMEIDRLCKSGRQSPKFENSIDRRRSIKSKNLPEQQIAPTPSLEISPLVSIVEPRGLHKLDLDQTNENQFFTRSQQSCSPDNGKIVLDNHFQNCSQNIQQLKVNTVGFSKSLNLISALIKDLDEKMSKIRSQKK